MSLIKRFLAFATWWNGATLNTRMFTSRHGEKVGEDEAGNVFFQTSDGKRRWVIYNGEAEASRVSPDWHGWLHHTYAEPPTKSPLPKQSWVKPHQANLTGSDLAYVPDGSLRQPTPKPQRDYEAWSPE